MSRTTVPPFPFAEAFADAQLDNIRIETTSRSTDLIVDLREIHPFTEPELVTQDGAQAEHVLGEFIPRRVRFADVTIKYLTGEYSDVASIPAGHPARTLLGMLAWQVTGEKRPSYRLFNASESADLWFSAKEVVAEERIASSEAADYTRTYSPAPPLAEGLVPKYPVLNRRFGGDPVTIHLGKRTYRQRLFVGSLDIQPDHRPDVDAVLNLGEESSKWVKTGKKDSTCDRWIERGEGSAGMTVEEITAEAAWVVERLQKNRRVLIHCVAGFNRSVTVCTAVLMLLEGLSPEDALARVREHHAWAKPDPVHWLRLKWLVKLDERVRRGEV